MKNFENTKIVGSVEFDFFRQIAACNGRLIELTAKEFALLWLLSVNAGESCSREELLETIWTGHPLDKRIIDVNICRLRRKLCDLFVTDAEVIKTDRNKGYCIKHVLLEQIDEE